MTKWRDWVKQNRPKWLRELNNDEYNLLLIKNICANITKKIIPSKRLREIKSKECELELLAILGDEEKKNTILKEKEEKMDFTRLDCLPISSDLNEDVLYNSQQFNNCMDDENKKILKGIWETRAYKMLKASSVYKRKPPNYWKDQKNVEKELTDLFNKYQFIFSKKELKAVRYDIFSAIHSHKYNYLQIIKSILPDLKFKKSLSDVLTEKQKIIYQGVVF